MKCLRVDGRYVRDHIDVEFTNGAHHFVRDYVPVDEIWIDRVAPGAGETRFLVAHQLRERALMAVGLPYLAALRRATRLERIERRSALAPLPPVEARAAIRRQLLDRTDGVTTWLVDGRGVRDRFHPDFTLGGHALRYRFIPRGEIWIDDAVIADERPAILHHEVVERTLMIERGLDYHAAHARASAAERRFRARSR